MSMAFLTQECRARDRKERHMTTMTTYQTALRERVLHLAARRPLLALAREMQVSRNTLSAWVAERGEQRVTVRTLQKIETWCAEQEAAEKRRAQV